MILAENPALRLISTRDVLPSRKMKLRLALPDGLRHKDCERFDPAKLGGMPPMRFVPDPPSSQEEGEVKGERIKIAVNDSVSKYFTEFVTGNAESIAQLISDHENIVADLKLEEKYNEFKKLKQAKEALLGDTDRMKKKTDEEKEELRDSVKELEASMVQTRQEAYDYFEKLIHPSLRQNWHKIVEEQCDSAEFVNLNGVKKTTKRGRTFAALPACYKQVMLWSTTADAAERHRRYLSTTIKVPWPKVKVAQGIARCVVLNDLTKYLPTLKSQEGSPASLPRLDKPYSELEMCTFVLSALPMSLSTAYWASKGVHFPTCLKKLQQDLELVETQQMCHEKIMDQLRTAAGGSKKKDAEGAPRASMKSGDRIPKKKKKGDDEKSSTREQRLCQLCAVHAPKIKNTHNTKDCKKFNADGTRKNSSGPRNANSHQSDQGELLKIFAHMQKEQRSMKKLLAKSTKKKSKKRSRKHIESSDDDSSSSDDE